MRGELLILGKSVIHHTHVIEQGAIIYRRCCAAWISASRVFARQSRR